MCYYPEMEISQHNDPSQTVTMTLGDFNNVVKIIENNNTLLDENKKLKVELSVATEKINWFIQQLKSQKSKKFGKSSEHAEAIQFDLFLGKTDQTVVEKALVEEEKDEKITLKTKSQGRCIDTSKLERERIVHDIASETPCCEECQSQLVKLGEETSEQLELVPGRIKVIEHVRIKYACRPCGTVRMAPKPVSPIPKCMAGAGLLTEVILAKYERHIPMYRQSQILLSQGLDIPDNTLVNWALCVFDVLAPLAQAMWEQLKITHVLQADDTRVKMLKTDKQGFMWCYLSCDPGNRYVLFAYDDSRSKEVPLKHLKDFNEGKLQTDGYSGFNEVRLKPGIIGFGCFAHCRRKFVDVIKISGNKIGKAHEAVKIIGDLYNIEREAEKLSFDERYMLRQQKAKPILELLHNWLKESSAKVGSKSKLSQAIQYALNQWDLLSAYVDHGDVQIDNNGVENQIRPFALGRRNWLFVGNHRGAEAAALFYSLIQTCKLNNIEPRKYFNAILNHVHDMRQGKIKPRDLLPQTIEIEKIK